MNRRGGGFARRREGVRADNDALARIHPALKVEIVVVMRAIRPASIAASKPISSISAINFAASASTLSVSASIVLAATERIRGAGGFISLANICCVRVVELRPPASARK